jgi:CMP-N-acetylneuraminic acid synthetase
VDAVVLLYANIPVRPPGAIDQAIELLEGSEADSVRSVCPVGKHHPDWMFRLEGDSLAQYRKNSVYRRQELEPIFSHDGAVVTVRRNALLAGADSEDAQAFWGQDCRGLVVPAGFAVDVDELSDLWVAEAALRWQQTKDGADSDSISVSGGVRP